MKRIVLAVSMICHVLFAGAQQSPKREMRGAWIATYANIDWPNRTQTPAQQRAAFISIVDHHKATGLNTLYVQVRSQCDALYPSPIEPWSADLTGTQGVAPNPAWDPLQFMIEECHKRGIEFHAWLNPYRAVANTGNLPGFAASHVAKQHPDWVLTQGTLKVLDPGLQVVRNYITSVIVDIVNRYDVDGVNFDDYFYPPAAAAGVTPYNDDSSFTVDPRGFTVKADWRRDNVNLLVSHVYDTIRSIKSWVKFGISPSGIYRNSTNPAIGTPTSGLEHYTTLFADSKKWLQQGWLDYLAPQVYWYIGQAGANYAAIVPWWNDQANGRHIYIGMAGYKVNDPAQGVNWANPSMIPNEMRLNRTYPNIAGQAIYNTSSMRSATKLGFRDSLRLFFYQKPALLPRMPWRDSVAPEAPAAFTVVKYGNDSVALNWVKPVAVDEPDKAKRFVIYRAETPAIDITNVDNILAITNTDTTAYADKTALPGVTYYYTVTALDRFHNESVLSTIASNLPPSIVDPGNQILFLNESCSIVLPDYRDSALVNGQQAAPGITITQLPEPGTLINGGGETIVFLTATDAGGNADTCQFSVITRDTLVPLITNAAVSTTQLWPATLQMKDVTIHYEATDNCGPVTNSLTITSNEPVTGGIYGNIGPDWEVIDAHHVKLRAEKGLLSNGRIYTITIRSTDTTGNSATTQVNVTVPRLPNDPITDGILTVKAYPNPSPNQFYVLTLSTSQQPLTMKVISSIGTTVEIRTGLAANGLFYLGGNYAPGIYYLEVIQGNNRQTIKLVKL
jgi:uncharacterized lipoprotein YddW (UPF0748 family)